MSKTAGELIIQTPEKKFFNEETNKFITIPSKEFHFQHSLRSIAEWESKYCKPFLVEAPKKSIVEMEDYYTMMCQESFSNFYLDDDVNNIISEYVNETPTATTINSRNDSNSRRIMTSEVIYAYMANASIPFECEDWNIARLFRLLGVIGELNGKSKPMPMSEIIDQQRDLSRKRWEEIQERKRKKLEENKLEGG